MPYYKWMFRAMRQLPVLGECADDLQALLLEERDREQRIEDVSVKLINALIASGLTGYMGSFLEPYAYVIQDLIGDEDMRSLHVMEGV